eukprot:12452879-Alexandrium_andersonii.AAC.1
MSASLVGSEMCIRDSPHLSLRRVPRAARFRDLVRPVLLEHLSSAPGLDSYLRELLAGRAPAGKDPPPGL